jgi:hypothetical protein
MISIVIASAVARSLPWLASWAGAWSHGLGRRGISWHDYALMIMAREVVKDTDIGGLYVVGPVGATRHINATNHRQFCLLNL